jgi:hypothetical protein
VAFGRKCSNCKQNPCKSGCAAQQFPASGSARLRPDGGAGLTPRQLREDAAYEAARRRSQQGGSDPHLIRYITEKQRAQGAMNDFRGKIDKVGSVDDDGYIQIILKKGNENELKQYKHH